MNNEHIDVGTYGIHLHGSFQKAKYIAKHVNLPPTYPKLLASSRD